MRDPDHRVAIVGTGPGGYYTAEYLLRHLERVRIDFLEKLPTPFGLVRGGVAPDHPKIKSVSVIFDKISRDPRVEFIGGVEFGKDVSHQDLMGIYDAVVLATGAGHSTALEVEGAGLDGVFGATDIVGWYNGVPGCREHPIHLDCEDVVVLGHGNVAGDIARILLSPIDALARTDIAAHALEVLSHSRVRRVHLVGRRGPAQMKFSTSVLRELAAIPACLMTVEPSEMDLNSESLAELQSASAETCRKNLGILKGLPASHGMDGGKRLALRFLMSVREVKGRGSVESVLFSRNKLIDAAFQQRAVTTAEAVRVDCGMLVASIGFRGIPISGVPFDPAGGIVPNRQGRVFSGNQEVDGLYVSGWIKRGATGIIGTNRADGWETGKAVCEDISSGRLRGQARASGFLQEAVSARSLCATSYSDWDHLDMLERDAGALVGKPREKMTSISEMHAALAVRSRPEVVCRTVENWTSERG